MTWVFNRTGQSLPMAMLLHVSVNNFAGVWGEMFPTWDIDDSELEWVHTSTVRGYAKVPIHLA